MKREDIKALLNTIRKKLAIEKGYKQMGFEFYFDAMSACELLTLLLEKGMCFTSKPYLAQWFDVNGFKVSPQKWRYGTRYLIK